MIVFLQVKDMKTVSRTYLPWYCFRGQYILSILVEGYHFDETSWKNINFINTVSTIVFESVILAMKF